jgi:hypothetical protein
LAIWRQDHAMARSWTARSARARPYDCSSGCRRGRRSLLLLLLLLTAMITVMIRCDQSQQRSMERRRQAWIARVNPRGGA